MTGEPGGTGAQQSAATSLMVAKPTPHGVLRRILKQRVSAACIVYLTMMAIIAIVAPVVMPEVATQQAGDLSATTQSPSPQHWLGTDSLGRDVLARILVGTRIAMLGLIQAVATALLLGVPLGLLAGYYHRTRIERAVGWYTDVLFSLPSMVVLLVLVAVFPGSTFAAMVTFGVIVSPTIVRVVRSATIPVSNELYIDAARVTGLRDRVILRKHVLPRIAGPIIVQASILAGVCLLVQIGLGFLGVVVPSPAPSWGGMIADGWSQINAAAWLILPPALVSSLTVLAFGLLGDGIRDATTAPWLATSTLGKGPQRPSTKAIGTPGASTTRAADTLGSGTQNQAVGSSLLEVRDLTVSTTSGVQIVQRASFSLDSGETLAIVGESGCGKTMTARSILGLLPSGVRVESGGGIWLRGTEISRQSEAQWQAIRGGEIALISQDPMVSLNPVFRIGWQLREAVMRHHPELSRRQAKERAIELLRQVDLPEPELVYSRYPHELSGGMAQRVSIARALSGEPDVLVADEPTTALDVTLQAEILALLRDLQSEHGMGLLMITHDWGVVATISDRVAVMYAGRVVEQGALAQVLDGPLHPYTFGLLASNPHHADKTQPLPAIGGAVPPPESWPVGCTFADRCQHARSVCTDGPIMVETVDRNREVRCVRHDVWAREAR